MRMKFFVIPVFDPGDAEAELNQFLSTHRIAEVQRELVVSGGTPAWAISVSYQASSTAAKATAAPGGKSRVDYKEVLSPEEFSLFAELRALRKRLADSEGVPVYALFNNHHLATMVQQKVRSAEDLQALDGVGASRVSKYGAAFLEVLSATPASSPDGEPEGEGGDVL